LIFLDLQLKQPPRDFLWDLLVRFGAKVRCPRALICVPSRSSEQSGSDKCDEVDEEMEREKGFIVGRRPATESCFADNTIRVFDHRDGHPSTLHWA
jgi:hypothetical protein